MKVRDGAHVRSRAAPIDMDGQARSRYLDQATEGATFWAGICAQLANRYVADVLIVCGDGLTGLPVTIETTGPAATVQACALHLIHSAMRFVTCTPRSRWPPSSNPSTRPGEDAILVALADRLASKVRPVL